MQVTELICLLGHDPLLANATLGLGWGSAVECWPSTHQALGSARLHTHTTESPNFSGTVVSTVVAPRVPATWETEAD